MRARNILDVLYDARGEMKGPVMQLSRSRRGHTCQTYRQKALNEGQDDAQRVEVFHSEASTPASYMSSDQKERMLIAYQGITMNEKS